MIAHLAQVKWDCVHFQLVRDGAKLNCKINEKSTNRSASRLTAKRFKMLAEGLNLFEQSPPHILCDVSDLLAVSPQEQPSCCDIMALWAALTERSDKRSRISRILPTLGCMLMIVIVRDRRQMYQFRLIRVFIYCHIVLLDSIGCRTLQRVKVT